MTFIVENLAVLIIAESHINVSSVSSRMNSAIKARIDRSVSVSVHCSVEYEIRKPYSAHYSAKKRIHYAVMSL